MADPHSHLGYRPCVGIMVINNNGDVWVGERKDARNNDSKNETWWQMPQGGIDEDEDPLTAARRELVEETGINSVTLIAQTEGWLFYDLPDHLVGKVWSGKFRGQKQQWFLFRFEGSDDEINITPDNPDHVEFVAWRWSRPDEIIARIIPFKRQVYETVMQTFAGHLTPKNT